MGNVIMKAQQITYGASNVEKALDDLNVPELIELNKRMDAVDTWKANVHEVTYTGSELTIDNALALPARSLITSINAIQDLHGYDHPWAGGAGKNKIENILQSGSSGNITWAVDGQGIITVSGYSESGVIERTVGEVTLAAGDYKLNGGEFPTGHVRLQLKLKSGGSAIASAYDNLDVAFTVSESSTYVLSMVVAPVTITGTTKLKPMIRLSTETDATFAPYSNICPISGRTEARVDDVGKNYYNTADLRKDGDITYTVNNGTLTITSRAVRPKVYFAPPDKFGGKNVTFSFKIDSITNGGGAVFFGLVIRNKATSTYRYASASNCTTTGNKSVSAVLAAEETIERIDFNVNDSSSALSSDRTYVLSNIQFEIGSTATAYVPYVTPTNATIQLGTTVYGGSLNVTTGVLTVTDACITLDGGSDENWLVSGTTNPRFILNADIGIKNVGADSIINAISSSYSIVSANSTYLGTTGISTESANSAHLAVFDEQRKNMTAEQWKTWLASNNVQVCYKLATPTTLQLTPTQLQMLKGYNRVTLADGYGEVELKALVLGGDV